MSAVRRSPVRGLAPLLIGVALLWLALVVLLPLGMVFAEAFRRGLDGFLDAFSEPDAWSAVRLTLLVAAISVPLNALFGLAAAWCITRYEFRGKALLTTLIDLPFSVSPVISGLVWVLLFGTAGWFAPLLDALGVRVIFTVTGLVLATILVTLPFVARELIPLMQQQGADEELAAVAPARGPSSPASPCRTCAGRCCTACCCATPAPWASSARCRWSRAISGA